MKNKSYILFAFILYLLIGDVSDVKSFEDRIIAVVNDDIITVSNMEASQVFPNKTLSSLIEKNLQLQIAKKEGIFIQPSEVSTALDNIKRVNSFKSDEEFKDALLQEGSSIKKYKRDITEQLTLMKLLNKVVKSKITVSDKELEIYYLTNRNFFLLPDEIKIEYIHIQIKTSDSIDAIQGAQKLFNNILSDLEDNIPFNNIQIKHKSNSQIYFSEDMGYIKKGELLTELDEVAFNLNEGEISSVINTPLGLYIIKMLEKRKREYRHLDEVKKIVGEILFQEKSEKMYKEWLYNHKSSSYIEIK